MASRLLWHHITNPIQWGPAEALVGEVLWLNNGLRHNPLSLELLQELERRFTVFPQGGEPSDVGQVRTMFLGAYGNTWSAGLDLRELAVACSLPNPTNRLQTLFDQLMATYKALWEFPGLTVACLQGPAIGGGMALASLCDGVLMYPEAYVLLPGDEKALLAQSVAPVISLREPPLPQGKQMMAPELVECGWADGLSTTVEPERDPKEVEELEERVKHFLKDLSELTVQQIQARQAHRRTSSQQWPTSQIRQAVEKTIAQWPNWCRGLQSPDT